MTAPVTLDYRPRAWQNQCHQQRKRFSVYALHRRAGKTVMACMELIDNALRCPRKGGVYIYLAPFLKQAKAIAWSILKQKLEPLRLAGALEILEGELTVLMHHNGAIIRLFGADNPDALRGMGLEGVVVDEVAQIKPEVWREILQPALADRLGWAIFIGTPNGINLFSELYYASTGKPEWTNGLWTVYETDALDPTEIERQRRDMDENAFAREFLCDFSAAAADQLISLTDIDVASRRIYKPGEFDAYPRIVGVDPARFGDDRSVLVKRQGLFMHPPSVWRGIDNMELASRVASVAQDWTPDAIFIDSGAGAGTIDRLRQLGYDVVEVPFGGRAIDAGYVNRRTEMWWGMREWIKAGGCIPNDVALKQELATPTYSFDDKGRKLLESKDDIKERLLGGGSPDIADALALTFAAPVHKTTWEDERLVKPRRQREAEYDPFDDGRLRGPKVWE